MCHVSCMWSGWGIRVLVAWSDGLDREGKRILPHGVRKGKKVVCSACGYGGGKDWGRRDKRVLCGIWIGKRNVLP